MLGIVCRADEDTWIQHSNRERILASHTRTDELGARKYDLNHDACPSVYDQFVACDCDFR